MQSENFRAFISKTVKNMQNFTAFLKKRFRNFLFVSKHFLKFLTLQRLFYVLLYTPIPIFFFKYRISDKTAHFICKTFYGSHFVHCDLSEVARVIK